MLLCTNARYGMCAEMALAVAANTYLHTVEAQLVAVRIHVHGKDPVQHLLLAVPEELPCAHAMERNAQLLGEERLLWRSWGQHTTGRTHGGHWCLLQHNTTEILQTPS